MLNKFNLKRKVCQVPKVFGFALLERKSGVKMCQSRTFLKQKSERAKPRMLGLLLETFNIWQFSFFCSK